MSRGDAYHLADPSIRDRANDYRTVTQACLDNTLCPGITVCKRVTASV